MNKQELLAAAEVMRRVGEGELPQYREKREDCTGQWENFGFPINVVNWKFACYEYRIVEFPSPPDGQTWHNPCGLNATQVGVYEGWRCLLQSECDGGVRQDCEQWIGEEWGKLDKNRPANLYHRVLLSHTFRTKSPLPVADPVEEAFKKYRNQALAFFPDWQSFVAGWKAAKEHENNQKDNK